MSTPFSFGRIEIGSGAAPAGSAQPAGELAPFRLAILGDFSGRASRGLVDPDRVKGLRPIAVDRDNFDEVLQRFGAELQLPIGAGMHMSVQLKELDDFRPDRLYEQVEIFEKLRLTRQRLNDPRTFAAAAEVLRGWAKPTPAEHRPSTESSSIKESSGATSGDDLLAQIMQATSERAPQRPAAGNHEWDAFLKTVVGSYAVPREDPRQPELIAQVDAAISGLMRTLLHQGDFQNLEATWRSLHFLVRRLETDDKIKLFVFDVSKEELRAAAMASDTLEATGIYRIWVDQTVHTPGAQPWAALASCYTFYPTVEDVALLGRLAQMAQAAGAPFLASAHAKLVGCLSFAETPDYEDWRLPLDSDAEAVWEALRDLPAAAYLGLAMPRFLLRLPYGKETDSIDAFTFEELPKAASHEACLWGSGAIACAYLLGEAFVRGGWSMRPGAVQDIEGLPVFVREIDGEKQAQPCAEALLKTRAGERITVMGCIPLLSYQGSDRLRLDSFRPVARSVALLAGRWGK